jgi:hypothetical protein
MALFGVLSKGLHLDRYNFSRVPSGSSKGIIFESHGRLHANIRRALMGMKNWFQFQLVDTGRKLVGSGYRIGWGRLPGTSSLDITPPDFLLGWIKESLYVVSDDDNLKRFIEGKRKG